MNTRKKRSSIKGTLLGECYSNIKAFVFSSIVLFTYISSLLLMVGIAIYSEKFNAAFHGNVLASALAERKDIYDLSAIPQDVGSFINDCDIAADVIVQLYDSDLKLVGSSYSNGMFLVTSAVAECNREYYRCLVPDADAQTVSDDDINTFLKSIGFSGSQDKEVISILAGAAVDEKALFDEIASLVKNDFTVKLECGIYFEPYNNSYSYSIEPFVRRMHIICDDGAEKVYDFNTHLCDKTFTVTLSSKDVALQYYNQSVGNPLLKEYRAKSGNSPLKNAVMQTCTNEWLKKSYMNYLRGIMVSDSNEDEINNLFLQTFVSESCTSCEFVYLKPREVYAFPILTDDGQTQSIPITQYQYMGKPDPKIMNSTSDIYSDNVYMAVCIYREHTLRGYINCSKGRLITYLDAFLMSLIFLICGVGFSIFNYNSKKLMIARNENIVAGKRRELLLNVAHEMKTPLGIIHLYGEKLRSEMIDEDNKNAEIVDDMILEIDKMNRLIQDILDVEKLRSEGFRLNKTLVSIPQATQVITEGYEPLADDKNLSISLTFGGECTVSADLYRIKQVISNYLSNAIKYSTEGGSIAISVTEEKNDVKFTICNDGSAIPEDIISRIWEPYFKNEADGNAKNGTGLGLAIVKSIIELHGGNVGVRNTDSGVSFFFTLPK